MADRFLVATGNSSSTAVWSASSGGAGGASVPGVADNAIADANSNGFTLTVDAALSVVNLTYSSTTAQLVLGANLTCSGTLTLVGTAGTRFYLRSGTRGTARTVTAATVALQYVDLEDITGAGAGSWNLSAITGGSGDCGGNSGITFTTPANNWLRGSGNRSFSTAANWANAVDGAAGSGRVPLPQDTAYLDATTGSGTITQDLPRIGALNCTGHTGTLTPSTAAALFGSWTLASGQTLTASTQTYTLAGRSASTTLTSAGKSWAKNFVVDCVTGKWTAGDALNTTGVLTITSGTFDDGTDKDVTIDSCAAYVGTATRALVRGSGTWTITGNGSVLWYLGTVATGFTYTKGTGLLKFTGNLSTNRNINTRGLDHYDIEDATTGAGFLAQTATTVYNTFKVNPGRTHYFLAGGTATAASWDLTGTSGSPITLLSTSTSTATIAKSGGGTVDIYNAIIDYLIGSPESTFYAHSSTDGGHNQYIYFASLDPVTYTLDPSRGRWSVTGDGSVDFTGVLATISALTGKVLVVTNVGGYTNTTSVITLKDGTTLLAEWKRDIALEGPSFNYRGRWPMSGSGAAVAAIVSGSAGCRITVSGYTLG